MSAPLVARKRGLSAPLRLKAAPAHDSCASVNVGHTCWRC